ncbi:multifunctional methyltransferase subunit TRM112-like protein isoform X2 [Macaca fascicularis]|uniref:multifunctional methyltransferase subunit TRM112-like protein isoform X2 n=1 Tax=Macaca fascicularis TaxID=9541 RepID=UPI0003E675B7
MKLLTHNLLSSHVRGVGSRGFPLRLQLRLIQVPKGPVEGYEENEEFLRTMHHLLLEVEVIEGTLQCPESGRMFPISRGIPNMLLSEEETES